MYCVGGLVVVGIEVYIGILLDCAYLMHPSDGCFAVCVCLQAQHVHRNWVLNTEGV